MKTIEYIYTVPIAVLMTVLSAILCLLYATLPKAIKDEYGDDIASTMHELARNIRHKRVGDIQQV